MLWNGIPFPKVGTTSSLFSTNSNAEAEKFQKDKAAMK